MGEGCVKNGQKNADVLYGRPHKLYTVNIQMVNGTTVTGQVFSKRIEITPQIHIRKGLLNLAMAGPQEIFKQLLIFKFSDVNLGNDIDSF